MCRRGRSFVLVDFVHQHRKAVGGNPADHLLQVMDVGKDLEIEMFTDFFRDVRKRPELHMYLHTDEYSSMLKS